MKCRSLLFAVASLSMTVNQLDAQTPSPKGLVPGKMWAAQTGDKAITLTWAAPSGVTGYRIYRCSGGMIGVLCPAARVVATVARNVTSAVYPILESGPVTYFLQAIGANGMLGQAVAFNAVTPLAKGAVASIPPKSSSVTAAQSGNTITVTWQPVAGATAYAIGKSVAPNGFRTVCRICSTETRFVDSVLVAGAKHVYSVSAITPAGVSRSSLSNIVTPSMGTIDSAKATIGDTTKAGIIVDSSKAGIAPPSLLQVVLSAVGAARLSWVGQDPKAAGYRVYRSVGTGPFVLIATLGNNTATFLDALTGIAGHIRYRVQAFDPKGASSFVEASVDKAATAKSGTKQ